MTPEERWTKIENAIQALVGSQAQHDAEIAENRAELRRYVVETNKQIARIGEQMERRGAQIDAQIEKNTTAIRDLIVVSRTILDAQETTEKQLQRLTKIVDAFIKGFQKPNGNQ